MGNSPNSTMPKTVAPKGSSKAIVAVSKDFRFDREENAKVRATAVGKTPNPISGRRLSIVVGNPKVLFIKANPKTLTIIAARKYMGSIVEIVSI
ncbi:MAG: hypothetical protein QXN95_00035 [Candidatus Bathyarchaeia archaeon]